MGVAWKESGQKSVMPPPPSWSEPFRRQQVRSQAGAMGAIAPSEGPITPSGASLGTLPMYVGVLRRHVMLYCSAQATDILLPR